MANDKRMKKLFTGLTIFSLYLDGGKLVGRVDGNKRS